MCRISWRHLRRVLLPLPLLPVEAVDLHQEPSGRRWATKWLVIPIVRGQYEYIVLSRYPNVHSQFPCDRVDSNEGVNPAKHRWLAYLRLYIKVESIVEDCRTRRRRVLVCRCPQRSRYRLALLFSLPVLLHSRLALRIAIARLISKTYHLQHCHLFWRPWQMEHHLLKGRSIDSRSRFVLGPTTQPVSSEVAIE